MLGSVRSRLVLSNLLITLLGLLIVVAVFVQLLGRETEQAKEQELRKQASAVAAQIERLFVAHGSLSDLRARADEASLILGERVIVVGPQGQHVVDSAARTPYDRGSWHPLLDLRALRKGRSFARTLADRHQLAFQAPLHSTVNGKSIGAVLLVAHVNDVRPNLSSLIQVALVLLATALFAWLLISAYVTSSVFRPILRMEHATARMASGDYDVEVPVRGAGELARLAAGFNTMASQVRRTNRAQRDFVANVSHDLRTPLTLISGYAEAMLDGTVPAEEVRSSAEVISVEADRMQRLVDDLLQLTKLEAGLLALEPRPAAVQPFVQGILDRVERAWADRPHAALRNEVPEDVPAISVDPLRYERAVQNLIENALQYTLTGGAVTVSARPIRRDRVEITVTDTGIGIAPEDQPRIFERFYRANRSREREHGNAGLGLAIVREIVEAHGGTVSVSSTVGKGSTFRITAPRATIPASSPRPASPTAGIVTR